MLQYKLGTKNGGFVLRGDYRAFKPLYELLMDLSEKAPVLDAEGLLPALAYDLRKAYEGAREKDKEQGWDDEITIYGVEQLWPTFIAQVALLRGALAFTESNKHDQGQVYLLEHFLEGLIQEAFPEQAHQILASYQGLIGTQENHIRELLGGRVSFFLKKTPKVRSKSLASILSSLTVTWSIMQPHPFVEGLLSPEDFEGLSWDSLRGLDVKI